MFRVLTSVGGGFLVLARVLSAGAGVGLNKLWRSGERERDVM